MNDNDKKRLAALIETLQGIHDGKAWEWAGSSSGECWYPPQSYLSPELAIKNGYTIRLKSWTLPPPPAGREWHCGERFVESDLPEGYRPMLVGEIVVEGDEFEELIGWRQCAQTGFPLTAQNGAKRRTKRPLPKLDPVPLGPEDVPPGSVFQWPQWSGNTAWAYPVQVADFEVLFVMRKGPVTVSYEALLIDGWRIKRPGQDWQPCSKPAP